jgi:glycine cleavage system protein P-like pyridoxal-binding family
MKYNPKVNEYAARMDGSTGLHPYATVAFSQAASASARDGGVMSEICGMDV